MSGTTSSQQWLCTKAFGCLVPSKAQARSNAKSTTPSSSSTVSHTTRYWVLFCRYSYLIHFFLKKYSSIRWDIYCLGETDFISQRIWPKCGHTSNRNKSKWTTPVMGKSPTESLSHRYTCPTVFTTVNCTLVPVARPNRFSHLLTLLPDERIRM